LSASSDKTVRLWHIYKSDCLCCFYHSSIISTISFHPKDDRYFVSACLAGKLRLWNISEKKVIHWNELTNRENGSNFITAICFCQSGKTIAVGTYDGKCILYQTEVS
jgi:WD40 repeat protein